MEHTEYMREALRLAKMGVGHTSPNPMVGAVVVKDNTIIGRGYHHRAGGPHAEVFALNEAGEEAQGATLYVTLEPCSHYGKTPPCADKVIRSGIKEVYVGTVDPNPLVHGGGIEKLQAAGIKVTRSSLEAECRQLNEAFNYFITHTRPFVTAKSAMSLDGKIATYTGDSQWITAEESRAFGHRLRAENDAILVGITTILTDNPRLNCRVPASDNEPHQPHCVILDSLGQTPVNAHLFEEENRRVLIFVSPKCTEARRHALQNAGAEVVEVPASGEYLDIHAVMDELGKQKFLSVLIEGGGTVLASCIKARVVQKVWTFIGDYLIGGKNAVPALGGEGAELLSTASRVEFRSVELHDNNIYIESYIKERES